MEDENQNMYKMKLLYSKQVAGTEDLYVGVGYFFRMRNWKTINDMWGLISDASTDDDCGKIYNYCLELMNLYIRNDGSKTSMENVNNMIFNRNLIIHNNPRIFVENLRDSLIKEKGILSSQHYVEEMWDQFQIGATEELPSSMLNYVYDEDLGAQSSMDEHPDQEFCMKNLFPSNFLDELEELIMVLEKDKQNKQRFESSLDSDLRHGVALHSHRKEQLLVEHCSYESNKFKLLQQLSKFVENLKQIKMVYLKQQAKMEVNLLPEQDLISDVANIFDRFASMIKKLYTEFDIAMNEKLNEAITAFVDLGLIVKEHPKAFVIVGSEKKTGVAGDDDGDQTGATKGKPSRSFHTKKKGSLTTSVMILGSSKLPGFAIKGSVVQLMTEDDVKCGDLYVPSPVASLESSNNATLLEFKELKITKYERKGSTNIRLQFVRLHYTLKVTCFDSEFEIKTKSLPFLICTGAIQELESIGTRLWYCGSNDDMYNNCQVYTELDRDVVLNILDQRVQSIKGGGNRCLSDDAKEFLLKMIPGQKVLNGDRKTRGAKDKITLKSFVKDKIWKKEEGKSTVSNFCFFTWFYAFVNTLECDLAGPWKDEVIYDLMTNQEAEQILLNEMIPIKTALIRPARSFVLTPNCIGAKIKVAVEIKLKKGNDCVVMVVDLDMKYIKSHETLSNVLKSIKAEEEFAVNFVLKKHGELCRLDNLEKHYSSSSNSQDYHATIARQISNMHLSQRDDKPYCPPPKQPKVEPEFMSPPRRKSASPGWSNAVTPLTFSSNDVIQNDVRSPDAYSQASTTYSPTNLERLNSTETSNMIGKEIVGPQASPNWTVFGQQEVDISNIKTDNCTIPAEMNANSHLANYSNNGISVNDQILSPTLTSEIQSEDMETLEKILEYVSNDSESYQSNEAEAEIRQIIDRLQHE